MAHIEPDWDQYDNDYGYEEDNQIDTWGAPYSRMLERQDDENESSSQQLLPSSNDHHYEGNKHL